MSTYSNPPSFHELMNNGTAHTYECDGQIKINSRGIWTGDNPLDFTVPLLMLQISLSFLVTWTIKLLLRPLKQPKIVSAIIGGIILGPSVLGSNETFQQNAFPTSRRVMVDILASVGVMHVIFLMAVKMDTNLVLNNGKKGLTIGLSCLSVPLLIGMITSYIFSDYLPGLAKGNFIFFLVSSMSVTAFPNLSYALDELELLNSELGRLAMSCAMMNDMVGWFFMALFNGTSQNSPSNSVRVTISVGLLVCFLIFIVRPLIVWVVKRTPDGRQVDEIYIITILLGVLVLGFITNRIGGSIVDGPLMFGLIIPGGPPLGVTLVEKSEIIVMEFLLPFFFILCGMHTDVFTIFHNWKAVMALISIIVIGFVGKLMGTVLPSLYYKMSFRSAVSLGLIMNMRGVIELITFLNWKSLELLDDQSHAILVISILLVTAIVTPLVSILYKPQKQFTTKFAGTIQRTPANSDFRILSCIHSDKNVPTIITLLESSLATENSHICVYVLHLVELVGQATSQVIIHDKHSTGTSKATGSERIMKAFKNYRQNSNGFVWIQHFTAIAPYNTMYQDICSLAQDKRVSLIILPFPQKSESNNGRSSPLRKLNINVLAATRCSVGILIDRGIRNIKDPKQYFSHHVAVIFFGGEDDREALAYGTRMSMHPGVTITVVRFRLLDDGMDNERERKLDEKFVAEFKLKNITNPRATFHEVIVWDGPEAMGVLRCLENKYDLVLVGQRRGTNQLFLELERMKDWSESPELGVVGDMLASSDFGGGMVSVLVLHQNGDVDGATIAQ